MSLAKVRDILYEVLISGGDDSQPESLVPAVMANQQMGVSVSPGMAKNGVKIFQLQNVVHQKVIGHVVEALRVIDALGALPEHAVEIRPIKITESNVECQVSLNELVQDALDKKTGCFDFLKEVEVDYVAAAIERYETQKEAAAQLQISYSKLLQVKEKIKS